MSAIGNLSQAQANAAIAQQEEKVLILAEKVNAILKVIVRHQILLLQWRIFNPAEKVKWLNEEGHKVKVGDDTMITRTDVPLAVREEALLEVINKRIAALEEKCSLPSSAFDIECAKLKVLLLHRMC